MLTSGGVLTNKVLGQSIINSLTEKTAKMPVLFMGHGNPMNGVEDNKYTRGWAEITKDIPTPKAILIISAHWETTGNTQIFVGEKPKMIYDIYGFPKSLYEVKYPVQGSPKIAQEIAKKVKPDHIIPTHEWGLDHGAWSVLTKMFPDASIPCFQLSLNRTRDLQWHYDLAKELAFLRDRGVLIMGSGNIVHNLRYSSQFNQPATDWALSFNEFVEKMIDEQNHKALIEYDKFGKAASISVNSAEHYIPLLYTLALQEKNEAAAYFNHDKGSSLMDVSMRCVIIGST